MTVHRARALAKALKRSQPQPVDPHRFFRGTIVSSTVGTSLVEINSRFDPVTATTTNDHVQAFNQQHTASLPVGTVVGLMTYGNTLEVVAAYPNSTTAVVVPPSTGNAPPTTPTPGTLPSAPSGPTAPGSGYRLVFADDFNGTSLDSTLWTLTPDGAASSEPFQSYEACNYLTSNVSVSASHCVLTQNRQTTLSDAGRTRFYGGAQISTSSGTLSSTHGFRYSPALAGTLYFEFKAKFNGSAPGSVVGSQNVAYPALWGTSCRVMGASSDNGVWDCEHDFFECASNHNPPWPDANIIVADFYGQSNQALINAGLPIPSSHGIQQKNIAPVGTSGAFDPSQDFHLWTVVMHTDGSFEQWIDGVFLRTASSSPSGFGAPTVGPTGSSASFSSNLSVAWDWERIMIQASMNNTPITSAWNGDAMLLDYVMVWQDAGVTTGTGIQGGGVAAGTTAP